MLTSEPLSGSGWVDSHCHLNDIPRLHECLEQAESAGIQQFLVPGTHFDQWTQVSSLHSDLIACSYGTHPWFVSDPDIEEQRLTHYLSLHKAYAVGEIGLDFYPATRPRPDRGLQIESFARQLSIAHQSQLPVIIHSVKAHQETVRLLKQQPAIRGVIHAFNGSIEMAQDYISLGFLLGIGPQLLRSEKLQRTVAQCPLDRLLLETDAPFMTRPGSQVNPLLDLIAVGERMATLFAIPVTDMQRQLTSNTHELFF